MMIKLLKYDLKQVLGFLVYFYVISFGFAVITRLINIGKDIQFIYIIGLIFAGITYAGVAQILINVFTQTLKIFITDFYKDESYLTHTLPVTKNQLLLAKYLTALITIVISVAVCVLDLFIVLYTPEFFEGVKALISLTVSGLNMSGGLFLFLCCLIILLQICAIISMVFSAIVKANTYNSKRVIRGFIWFFIYYFASMVATLAIATIVFAITGNLSSLFAQVLPQSAFVTILIIGAIAYFVYSILFYFMANKNFNKGVNVD